MLVIRKTSIIAKVFGTFWGLGFGGIPWIGIVLPILLENNLYIVTYIIGIICIAILLIIFRIMPKRTPLGIELLGKIKGFRRFLETAEKEQLEKLVEDNPEYFYNILPYTYALEISTVWMKKFRTIGLQEWDTYSSDFYTYDFANSVLSAMNAIGIAMSSVKSSNKENSSSDSSGGGSSGGGYGGGGGGSW